LNARDDSPVAFTLEHIREARNAALQEINRVTFVA
jgi:hypothetical protein